MFKPQTLMKSMIWFFCYFKKNEFDPSRNLKSGVIFKTPFSLFQAFIFRSCTATHFYSGDARGRYIGSRVICSIAFLFRFFAT